MVGLRVIRVIRWPSSEPASGQYLVFASHRYLKDIDLACGLFIYDLLSRYFLELNASPYPFDIYEGVCSHTLYSRIHINRDECISLILQSILNRLS